MTREQLHVVIALAREIQRVVGGAHVQGRARPTGEPAVQGRRANVDVHYCSEQDLALAVEAGGEAGEPFECHGRTVRVVTVSDDGDHIVQFFRSTPVGEAAEP